MPDVSWDWPKQGTADEANRSLADFTQQHVSTCFWLGPRAQNGYEGLLGQTCGSQYSYLMLKRRLQTNLRNITLWHMPANEFAKSLKHSSNLGVRLSPKTRFKIRS